MSAPSGCPAMAGVVTATVMLSSVPAIAGSGKFQLTALALSVGIEVRACHVGRRRYRRVR
jgi:hypothetical protein